MGLLTFTSDALAWSNLGVGNNGSKGIGSYDQRNCINSYSVALSFDDTGDGDDANCVTATGAVGIGYYAQAKGTNSVAIGRNAIANIADSVVIGFNSTARSDSTGGDPWTRAVVVGSGSTADGQQATVLGSTSGARSQATAIGNDVYAVGNSSIAIGNDDITDPRYQDKLPVSTIDSIYSGIWSGNALLAYGGSTNTDDNTFYRKYIKKGTTDQRIFSPTLAGKLGAIAIGSRTVAGGEMSTSLGSLSFALADRSTAVGLRAFVADTAVGATAMGEQAFVFAQNSVAIGNKVEATQQGAFTYGYDSKAVGSGSLALGYGTGAAAKIDPTFYAAMNTQLKNLHNTPLISDTTGDIDTTADATYKATVAGALTQLESRLANNTLYVQDTSKEYLDIGGKKVYATVQNSDSNVTGGKAENALAMGRYAFALKNNSMAFGYLAIADGSSSIAFGAQTHATDAASNSVALGVNAYVNGRNSSALGYAASVLATNATAVGTGARVEATADNAIAVGIGARASGSNSIILGNLSKTTGDNTIAVGRKAQADAIGSMVFGNEAQATLRNSVAIGYRTITDYTEADLSKSGYAPKGTIAIPTIKGNGVVSVGSTTAPRRIAGLASGSLDTDAVNVAQLRSLDEKFERQIASIGNDEGVNFLSVDKTSANSEGGG